MCCVGNKCTAGGKDGICRSQQQTCPGGPSMTQTVPQKILAQAQAAAGLPYAWGGGNCAGPTVDNPPYKYGGLGFDCSGLLCWAVCKVTGRDLFSEGLRNTRTMYCASEATLKYQKHPYAERQAGDAVFFGGTCDCGSSNSIHHVGIVMDNGDRMFNAPNDQVNMVLESSIASFGEAPCPYVIRFT